MDVNVIILNALDWSKGDKEGSTLVYLLVGKDYFQNTEKFIGYPSITNFYDKHIKDKISDKSIATPLKGKLSIRRSLKDPTITYAKLESITTDNGVINLL